MKGERAAIYEVLGGKEMHAKDLVARPQYRCRWGRRGPAGRSPRVQMRRKRADDEKTPTSTMNIHFY